MGLDLGGPRGEHRLKAELRAYYSQPPNLSLEACGQVVIAFLAEKLARQRIPPLSHKARRDFANFSQDGFRFVRIRRAAKNPTRIRTCRSMNSMFDCSECGVTRILVK